ncbi:MAG: hypothetical protein IVW52_18030 [Acidimicrobiales bacterium]|nr:hypothetical protein [Acidimicrobiales bacterium]
MSDDAERDPYQDDHTIRSGDHYDGAADHDQRHEKRPESLVCAVGQEERTGGGSDREGLDPREFASQMNEPVGHQDEPEHGNDPRQTGNNGLPAMNRLRKIEKGQRAIRIDHVRSPAKPEVAGPDQSGDPSGVEADARDK